MSYDKLANRVAIISGAARGIGTAEAGVLIDAGASVVLGDVLDEPGARSASDLNALRGKTCARYVHLDATRFSDWSDAVRIAEETSGAPTILVNNACVSGRRGLEDTSEAEWHHIIDSDLTSAWLGMKACIPAIRRGGGGAIVIPRRFTDLWLQVRPPPITLPRVGFSCCHVQPPSNTHKKVSALIAFIPD